MNFSALIEDTEIPITITTYHPGRPAYTSGLPENCYPEEPGELEWEYGEDVSEFMVEAIERIQEWQDLIEQQALEYLESREDY